MSSNPYEPEVLLAHAGHVRQLARRPVFDADLAREVEQETWLAALEHAPRHLANPRAWLSRVARHAAHRLWARRERREEHELRTSAEVDVHLFGRGTGTAVASARGSGPSRRTRCAPAGRCRA